jgi:hypothetical protein
MAFKPNHRIWRAAVGAAGGGAADVGATVGTLVGVLVAVGAAGVVHAANIPISITVLNRRMDVFLDIVNLLLP